MPAGGPKPGGAKPEGGGAPCGGNGDCWPAALLNPWGINVCGPPYPACEGGGRAGKPGGGFASGFVRIGGLFW